MALRDVLEKFTVPLKSYKHEHYGLILCGLFVIFPWWTVVILTSAIGVWYEYYQKKTSTGTFDLIDALWVGLPSYYIAAIINIMIWVPRLF